MRRIVAMALCAGWALVGSADAGAVLSDASGFEQAAQSEITAALIGHELARVASIDLGLRPRPKPEDYLIAGHAMSLALSMRPGDAELARLAAAAAWSSGDRAMLLDATRSVIKADPEDTVAQLRLLSSNINARQTVEGRISAYERILGPAGAALDSSVRSRLALDAALLLRETGDNEGFESRLRQSVELDMTNKDAVSLAARTFATVESGVEELIEWQIRLLYADPFDPHVHLTIARICAGQGALDSAERFLDNGVAIYEVSGFETPVLIREQRLALLWQQEGPQAVLDSLNGPLYDLRTSAAAVIQARQEAGEPHDDIRNPEEIRYDIGIERIRLLSANAAGDDESIASSLNDLELTTQETLRLLAEQMQRPDVNRVQYANEIVGVFGDLQIMRGILGRDTEKMLEETESFIEAIPSAGALIGRVEPWVAYARGEYQDAIDLAETGERGALMSLLIALSSEKLDDIDRAARIYTTFALTQPLDAYGAYARSRLQIIGREGDALSNDGVYLEERLGRLPGWLDRMLSEPRAFMLLQVDVPSRTTDALTGSTVRISLKNTSPIPLGLGSSRPIGSRFLIAPKSAATEVDFVGDLSAKVVDLDRRFRLKPLESIEVVLEADSPYSEWLRLANAHVSQRDRYRVLQSFQPGPLGGLVAGPLGLVSETTIVQRTAMESVRSSVDEMESQIENARGAELRAAVVASLSRLTQSGDSPLMLSTGEKGRIASAWQRRFASGSDLERSLMVLGLPHAGQVFEMEAFDQSVIETVVASGLEGARSDDALLASVLFTRVRSPESPVFELAAASKDAHVRALGGMLQQRLRDFDKAYATVGPGLNALGPPTDVLRVDTGP